MSISLSNRRPTSRNSESTQGRVRRLATHQAAKRRSTRRLFLESLEDRRVMATTQFTYGGNIAIPSSGNATPYPAAINVSGLQGNVTFMAVDVLGLSHTFPNDIDMLLESPVAGRNAVLMSDVGGTVAVSGVNITFNDSAAGPISNSGSVTSGLYQLSNLDFSTDTFSAPAPAPAAFTSLASGFNGINPNGTWNLYVVDDVGGDNGNITGGYRLNFRTSNPVIDAGDLGGNGQNNGTADNFRVVQNGSNLEFYVNGTLSRTQPLSEVTNITVNGSGDTDSLNLDISGGNFLLTAGFNYNSIENVTVTGSGSNDVFQVNGGAVFSYVINGITFASLQPLASLTFNGNGGNDGLTMNYATGAVAFPVNFDGGAGGLDTLTLTGGSVNTVTHNFTNANDGSVNITGQGAVNYLGLDPIVDNLNAVNRIFNFNGGAETITFGDDPTANNNVSRIQSTLGELVDFVTPTATMTINSGAGPDTINLQVPDLQFNTPALTVNASTSADTINVTGSRAATTTTINAGDGLDNVNIGTVAVPLAPGLLTPVAGAVIVNGDALGANLLVDGSGAAVLANYQITNNTITRSTPAGFGGVTYNGLVAGNDVTLRTGAGQNAITIPSTRSGLDYFVFTGDEADTVTLGTNLDSLLHATLTVDGQGGAGQNDVLNVDDTTGGVGDTFTITSTTVTRPVVGFNGVAYSNFETVNVLAGPGGDIVNVNSTVAGTAYTVDTAAGADTVNVGALDNILGTSLAINGQGGVGETDTLNINDTSAFGDTYTLTATSLTRPVAGFNGLTYSNIESLSLATGAGGDIVNVTGTSAAVNTINTEGEADEVRVTAAAAGTQLNIDTGLGVPDRVVIGAASFAVFNTGAGTLANVQGQVNVQDSSIGETYIDNSGDATNGRIFDFADLVAIPFYGVDGIGLTAPGYLAGSINVGNNAADGAYHFADGNGSSTHNIQSHIGDTFTDADFFGNGGDDVYNVNVTVVSANPEIVIHGNGSNFAATGGRDVVNITEVAALGAQNIGITYTGGVGDTRATVTGAGRALRIDTVETIRSVGNGNDNTVLVTGTLANQDLLTVAPIGANRGLVFNNSPLDVSGPFDGPPQNWATRIPGVSGGSVRPDLDLISLANNGLTVSDATVGVDDRLYIYGESTLGLNDGRATDPFFLGTAGQILPAVAEPGSFDLINSSDTVTTIDALLQVRYNATDFQQALPNVDAAIVINAGFEGNPVPTVGTDPADQIALTLSPTYKFQVNGGDPDPATTGIVPPDGDALLVGGFFPVINVFATKTPGQLPIVSFEFPGSGNLGFSYSSIENLGPFFAGTVNLIGDNNDPAVDQNDNYVVVGQDTDGIFGDVDGANEFTLEINGSLPISFGGVEFLNAFGDDQNPPPGTPSVGNDIDTLELTPYADDTPRGWGIDVSFDEGNPIANDGVQDLIILHTSLFGGQVSENIVIKPSGPDNGEIIVTNASFGTPIVDIDYVANTDIIVLDDDGFLNDTDTLTLLGTNPDTPQVSGDDTFNVDLTAAGDVANPLVTVNDGGTILYRVRNFAGFNTLNLAMLNGRDTATVIGRNDGAVAIAIDGGVDSLLDTVNYTGTVNANDTLQIGVGPTSDTAITFNSRSGAANFTRTNLTRVDQVNFQGGGGTGIDLFTVFGSDGADQVTVQPTSALAGSVSVDGFPAMAYSGLGTGNAGTFSAIDLPSDNFNNGNLDSLKVIGTFGADTYTYTPTSATNGTLLLATGGNSVNIRTTNFGSLAVDAAGGADVLTMAVTHALLTPGATSGSSTVTPTTAAGQGLLPITYSNLETTNITAGTVVVTGTDQNDTLAVSTAGLVTLTNGGGLVVQSYNLAGSGNVVLNALAGDDTITVAGNHPFAGGVAVNGGAPSAGSDVLNFNGGGAAVTAVYAAATIQETGFGAVALTSIEVVNANAGGGNLSINTTNGDDALTVTPTLDGGVTARLTTAPVGSASPVINASNVGSYLVNMLAGSDELAVVYTQFAETITVTGASVSRFGLETVNYFGAVSLRVLGLSGSDTFNVTPSVGTSIFIDGGDPIGTSGDTLSLTPPGAFTLQPGPEPDEGGLVGAGVQRVAWDHIEDVIVNGGGPGLVVGTNGDDDITIIARDASTHAGTDGVQDFTVTVNDSFSALFINQPTLFVDALAGDDDIVVRAPAPNNANWNVQITLAGGPPASATGDQGDVLEIETPGGADQVIFTPTGPETGTFTIDQGADSVITFLTTFTFDPAGINYISSPGGIEKVVYDGVAIAGLDNLTINGTIIDDTLNYSATAFGGTFQSVASPEFEFSLTGRVTFNGNGSFDTVNLAGTAAVDTVTSTATAVSVNAPGSLFILTIGTAVERLSLDTGDGNDSIDLDLQVAGLEKIIYAGAGNDTVNLQGVVVDPADPTIYGGDGDDIIVGSPNPDLIFGGRGDDVLRGDAGVDKIYGEDGNDTFGIVSAVPQDAGNDFFYGGAGSDLFIWNPGDGNDLFEGGAGEADRLQFQGNAGAGPFTLNAVATRLEFLFGAGVDLDVADTEEVLINTLTGADLVTVNDLFATDVRHVTVDLTAGDVGDSVTVNGRNVSDTVNISAAAGVAAVTGLRYDVRVLNAVFAENDLLIFNGNDGNDNVFVNDNTSALYAAANLQVNGGNGDDSITGHGLLSGDAGNDTLTGGTASQALNGGTGNDVLNGLGGVDTMDGGAGEDLFYVNFDAATDNFIGGADYDTVLIVGTSGNDVVAGNQTAAGTLVSSLNGVNDTDSITTIERVRIEANSGDDIIFVQHLEALGTDGATNSVLFDVEGGAAFTADRLVVQDNGASNVMIYRKSATAGAGSVTVGPAVAEPLYTVFTGIEYVDPITGTPENIYVFKADPFEWNGNFQNATHLGADLAINVDPVIDPGVPNIVLPPGFSNPPADEDFYRIEAQETGTLDVQVFFRHNAGLPGGGGDIDIQLLDVDGSVIASDLDIDDNARVRIPAVEGQIYFLRVFQGQAGALNVYSVTIVNEAAPVPFDLELDDDPVNGTPNPPGQADNSDTGRSQNDNITYDNTPTIIFRVPDNELINDVPDNSAGQPGAPVDGTVIPINFQADTGLNAAAAGFRVAVFRTENNVRTLVGYASSLGNGVYSFTFPAAIPDGSNFISARVEIVDPTTPEQNQGFGAFAAHDLEIFVDTVVPPVFFGQQSIAGDGLHPNSDSGVLGPDPSNVATLSDRITNDTTPTFWGRAEADAIIRAYVDVNGNSAVDLGTDIFIGFTTALPYDGTNQLGNPAANEPNGYWELTSVVNLDSQAVLTALGVPAGQTGGLRRILISAEDVAGNITSGAAQVQLLNVFIDEQGPQITGVEITGQPGFDIFDPKSSNVGQSPTPLVNSLSVFVQDFPARLVPPPVGGPGTDYPALQETIAEIAAHYQVRGDFNGIIPIASVQFIGNAPTNGNPATGTIVINFFNPLPDDRYTLTIQDDIVDPAGNRLDGEANASEPQEDPIFPSGDGVPGGDFVARFTVDSRPELGTWAAGSVWVDTNGNSFFDQNNLDYTNRDIAYLLGYTSDELFAGNFANAGVADGFDKLAAYGKVGNNWRWLIDTDNDGVPNLEIVDPARINGFPVSGDFAPGLPGDEVGLFTGNTWYLDNNGDFNLQAGVTVLPWRTQAGVSVSGYGFTGDFDGDGVTDLGTWTDDTFQLDLSTLSPGFAPDGRIDTTFRFGFPGARERPVAHDMNQDGFDDIGLWVPDRTTQTPGDAAEWYFLVSGLVANDTPGGPAILGPSVPDRVVVDPITPTQNMVRFTPVPFGNDLYYQYGDEFSLPILGNFDPPLQQATELTLTNHNNSLDVNNDGKITAFDAIAVINRLNLVGGPSAAPAQGFARAPFLDVDGNQFVTAFDALRVINYLNANPVGGEDVIESFSAGEDTGIDEELLYLLATDESRDDV